MTFSFQKHISPSIVIGLGGLGVTTCRFMRDYLLFSDNPEHRNLVITRRLQFMGCDSDPQSNETTKNLLLAVRDESVFKNDKKNIFLTPLIHFNYLDKQAVKNACNEICSFLIQKNKIDNLWPLSPQVHESILQWFPKMETDALECLKQLNISYNNRGVANRLMGRMGFFMSVRQIFRQLRQIIVQIPKEKPSSPPIRIYFITSLFGNTGSSLLMDMIFLLPLLFLDQEYIPTAVLISGNSNIAESMSHHARLNAYACITELDMLYRQTTNIDPKRLNFPILDLNWSYFNGISRLWDKLLLFSADGPRPNSDGSSELNNQYTANQTAQTLLCDILTAHRHSCPTSGPICCGPKKFSLSRLVGLFKTVPGRSPGEFAALLHHWPHIHKKNECPKTLSETDPMEPEDRTPSMSETTEDKNRPESTSKKNLAENLNQLSVSDMRRIIATLESFLAECRQVAKELNIPLLPDGISELSFSIFDLPCQFIIELYDPENDFIIISNLEQVEKNNHTYKPNKSSDPNTSQETIIKVPKPDHSTAFLVFYDNLSEPITQKKLTKYYSVRAAFKKDIFPHLINFSLFVSELKQNFKEQLDRQDAINVIQPKPPEQNCQDQPCQGNSSKKIVFSKDTNSKSGQSWCITIPKETINLLIKLIAATMESAPQISNSEKIKHIIYKINKFKSNSFVKTKSLQRDLTQLFSDVWELIPDNKKIASAKFLNFFKQMEQYLLPDSQTYNNLEQLIKQVWTAIVQSFYDEVITRRNYNQITKFPFYFYRGQRCPFQPPGKAGKATLHKIFPSALAPEPDLYDSEKFLFPKKFKKLFPSQTKFHIHDTEFPHILCLYEENGWQKNDLNVYHALKSAFDFQWDSDKHIIDFYLTLFSKDDIRKNTHGRVSTTPLP